jgi:tetratricopeptide (TPR) repeat protein
MTPDTLATIAQIDRERNDAVALLGAVRMLTVLDAGNRDWRIIYGDLLTGARQYEEAAAVLRTLLNETPDNAPLALRLGNVLIQQRQLREAAATFETAWRLGAADPQVPRMIAGIWSEEGDFRQALLWAERAEKQATQPDPRLILQLADLHFKLQEHEVAESYAKRLADADDRTMKAPARLILGQIAVARGDTETAMGHWRVAVDSGYTGVDLLSHLAAYYYNARDFASAATYLQRVVDQEDAANEQLLRFLIVSCLQVKDQKRAEVYLQKYLERHGLSEEASNLIKAWVHNKADGPAAGG